MTTNPNNPSLAEREASYRALTARWVTATNLAEQALCDLCELQGDLEALDRTHGRDSLPLPLRDHLERIADFNTDASQADLLTAEQEQPEAYFLEDGSEPA
ncbi:hypothetical protein E4V01_20675 [Methylorubrum sp. Q1]|uniref:hypothetical protein n=1 Tax=Methylorubrum sp. Q1 TaxID=2562453 RepID=UPI001075ED0A|nr:hypothetical protein [Methylorubrum sp. Q1]TFZ55932.1 hypothetical protein E4V01_20675 [Methylorubrum sp. Q1]